MADESKSSGGGSQRKVALAAGLGLIGVGAYQLFKGKGAAGPQGPQGPSGCGYTAVNVDPRKFQCAPPFVWTGKECRQPGAANSGCGLDPRTFNCLPGYVWNGGDCVPAGTGVAVTPVAPAVQPTKQCGYQAVRVDPRKFDCIPGYGWTGSECRPLYNLANTGCGLNPTTFQCKPGYAWNGVDCVPSSLAPTGSRSPISNASLVQPGWIISTGCASGQADYVVVHDVNGYQGRLSRVWIKDNATWQRLGVPRNAIRVVTASVIYAIRDRGTIYFDGSWHFNSNPGGWWLVSGISMPPNVVASNAGYC